MVIRALFYFCTRMRFYQKTKEKWGIENNFQFWLIIFIFSISGTSTLFIKGPLYALLGITETTSSWIRVMVYLLAITPAYFIILGIYAIIFGQFRFFSRFFRSFFSHFKWIKGRVGSDHKAVQDITHKEEE
ncbi:MAG: DUF6787 family protein [Bacteroidales bacterium]